MGFSSVDVGRASVGHNVRRDAQARTVAARVPHNVNVFSSFLFNSQITRGTQSRSRTSHSMRPNCDFPDSYLSQAPHAVLPECPSRSIVRVILT